MSNVASTFVESEFSIVTVPSPSYVYVAVAVLLAVKLTAVIDGTSVAVALFTVTLNVVVLGAWFVPSDTLTVTVVFPTFSPLIVIVFPETDTVATLVPFDTALISPSPLYVTVAVVVVP